MANDVSISFGGDTSGLNSAIAQARANLASFAPQTTGQARTSLDQLNATFREARATSEAASSGWRDNIRTGADLITVFRGVKATLEEFAETQAKAAGILLSSSFEIQRASLQADAEAFRTLTSTISGANAAYDAAAESIKRYFTSAGEAARNTRLFEQAQSGLIAAYGRGLAGVENYFKQVDLLKQGTGDATLAAITAMGNFDKFGDAVAASGNKFGPITETIAHFSGELSKIPGMTKDAAAGIEATIAGLPNFSVAANEVVVAFLQKTSTSAEDATKNVEALSAALKSTAGNGGASLADALAKGVDFKNLELAKGQLDDIVTLASQLRQNFADANQVKAFFDTLQSKLDQYNRSAQQGFIEQIAAIEKLGPLGAGLLLPLQSQAKMQGEVNDALRTTMLLLQMQSQASKEILATQKTYKELTESLSETPASKISSAEDTIGKLTKPAYTTRRNPDADRDISAEEKDLAIRTIIGEAGGEGIRGQDAVANVIKNRLDSGRYGGSLFDVLQPSQFNSLKANDPTGALSKSDVSLAYQQAKEIYEARFEDKQSKLYNLGDDPTKGATHFLNPATAEDKSWMGSMMNVTPIGNHVFGNTPDSPPVLDDDKEKQRLQTIRAQNDAKREQQTIEQGGNEVSRASADIAERNLTAAKDDVAAQKEIVAAAQKDYNQTKGGTEKAQADAKKALVDAEQALNDKETAQKAAAINLQLAQVEKGTDEERQLKIQLAEIEKAKYAEGTAGYINAQKQIVEANKAFKQQQVADAVSAENISFEAAKRRVQAEREQIMEKARLGDMSSAEETTALLTNNQELIDIEAAHWSKMGQLQRDYVRQYRDDMQKKTLAEQEGAANAVKIAQSASNQIRESYKQAFEQVGQTVTSTVAQIIQRQATLKDLARNVTIDIIQQAIGAEVKYVADKAALYAFDLAQYTAAQTGMTGATAAGTAARSGIITVAAVNDTALQGLMAMKSIITSAAQAAAGTFANLSAFLGPLAAAPAAAVESTVLGFAGMIPKFDIGAYRLPSDMFAQVHAGEMIVPAGPAEAFRTMLESGGGGGGKSRGGDTYLNISAIDGRSMAAFFDRHGPDMVKSMNKTIRRNPSLWR